MTYSQFRDQQHAFLSSHGILKYIDKGQGQVMVLLHGVPTSGWLYRKMLDALSQNYRVIVPDMLGFGSSDSPKGYDIYAPKEHASRLLELMRFLKINSWTHIFHDAGGLWTWELLKLAPKKITRLIILNTIIFEHGFNPPLRFKKGFIARCIMALYSNGISTNMMLKGLFKTGLVNDHIITKPALEGYKKPMLEGKTKAMYHFFTQTCNKLPDYTSVYKTLNMPKLLIWGEHDSFLVFKTMEDQVVSNLKIDKDHIHLINAKHFIQEEQPEILTRLILNFTDL